MTRSPPDNEVPLFKVERWGRGEVRQEVEGQHRDHSGGTGQGDAVYFDWKESGHHNIGTIAEEVGEVVPEVVNYKENGADCCIIHPWSPGILEGQGDRGAHASVSHAHPGL